MLLAINSRDFSSSTHSDKMNKFRRRSVLDVLVEASGEGLREAYVVNCAEGWLRMYM